MFLTKQQIKSFILSIDSFEDCSALDDYCDIIFNNLSRTKNQDGQYTEAHHILPRCVSVFCNIEVDNSSNNLVNLQYKDHVLAHYYLALACVNNELFMKLQVAICMMLNNETKVDKITFEKMQKFVFSKIERLQEIHNKRLKIIYESDLKFYNELNEYFKNNKTYYDWDNEHNKKLKTSYSRSKYLYVCDKWNLPNENPYNRPFTKDEDLDFYNKCNELIKLNKSLNNLDQTLGYSVGYSQVRYCNVCKKYNLNSFTKKPYTLEQDKEFYKLCNKSFEDGKQLDTVDETFGYHKKYSITRYINICKKYNWENQNPDSFYTKDEDLDFYNIINNFLLSGKYCIDYDKNNNFRLGSSAERYRRICKRYNLKNNVFKRPKTKAEQLMFYNDVNEYLDINKTYIDFDKDNSFKLGYTNNKYNKICKQYSLQNHNKKVSSKVDDITFYMNVNEYLNNGKTFIYYDVLHNYKTGFTGNKYRTICIKYSLKNYNTFFYSKEEDIAFYNDVNKYLEQGKSLVDYDKDNKYKLHFTQSRYNLICKKHKLVSKINYFHSKSDDLSFYDLCNKYFKDNKKLSDLDSEKNFTKRYSITRYTIICEKYKLENKNPLKQKSKKEYKSYTPADDKLFYNNVNEYLNNGKSFIDYDSDNKYRKGYTHNRYRRICVKYKLIDLYKNKKQG